MPMTSAGSSHGALAVRPGGETAQENFPVKNICRLVQLLACEMVAIAGERALFRRDRRRALCHTRQIAMYVCHVALQIPQGEIGIAFGRDRSTVRYSCGVVEDRRDDKAFDEFVSALERISREMFQPGDTLNA